MAVVYGIQNIANGKLYVGSAVKRDRRWMRHLYDLRKGNHGNRHLQHAFLLYGEKFFHFFPIENVPDDANLLDREQHWIDELKVCDPERGYNIARYADAPTRGRPLTDEHKAKISASSGGWHHTPETKARISIAKRGNCYNVGTKRSEESKAKMSAAATARYARQRLNNSNE